MPFAYSVPDMLRVPVHGRIFPALNRSILESHRGTPAHRDVRGGSFRAAIFGVSDGLVSNVSLVLGTAGAHAGPTVVRLAGIAGLVGGAFSMATGEYVSMAGQREVLQREIALEQREIAEHPGEERDELEHLYRLRGVSPAVASRMASDVMADPQVALLAHTREELGLDPSELGSPMRAALASFVTFGLGALVPLVPYLSNSIFESIQLLCAIALTAVAAICVGGLVSFFTGRSHLFSAFRSLVICTVAGATTFGIGDLLRSATGH
jgi:vacuolar iron transporter family protein